MRQTSLRGAPSAMLGTSSPLNCSSKSETASSVDPDSESSSSTVRKTVKLKTKDRSKSSKPKIYTKTGDGGNSSLFTGERRPKSDEVFEALGTIDELSSHIGLAMAHSRGLKHPLLEQLQRIQCILQDVGSAVATPYSSARKIHQERTQFSQRHTSELEEWIDEYTAELPPIQNFILPGGSLTSATLHIARSVCRRAERKVQPICDKDEVDREAMKYLNRLSDFLFTAARIAAKIDNTEELIYIRPDTRNKAAYKPALSTDVWKKAKKADDE